MRDLQPSPDAAEMADALRSGVALRRQREASAPGADAARLTALGDLESLGPVAKPGAAAPIVKLGRRLLLVFLRPWLAMQTIFNREVARRFDESATITRDLRRRLPLVEDAMQAFDARLRAVEGAHQAAASVTAASSDRAYVQRLFVHSRLPPPPASVLVLPGVDADIVSDLRGLGYDLVGSSGGDADAVVATTDESASALGPHPLQQARLRAGARAIVLALSTADRESSTPPGRNGPDAMPGWRVEECLVIADGAWSVVAVPDAGQVVIGTVTVRDSQADAPAR